MKSRLDKPGNWLIALDTTYRAALLIIESLVKYDITDNIELSYLSQPYKKIVSEQKKLFVHKTSSSMYKELCTELPSDVAELAFNQSLRRQVQKSLNVLLSSLQTAMHKLQADYDRDLQHMYIVSLQIPVSDVIAERFEKPTPIYYNDSLARSQASYVLHSDESENDLLLEYVKKGGDRSILLNGVVIKKIPMGNSLQIMFDEVFKQNSNDYPLRASVPENEKKNINTRRLINNSFRKMPAEIRSSLFKSRNKGKVLLVTPRISCDDFQDKNITSSMIQTYLEEFKK